LGREADHSPPSRAEVKITWSYTSTPIRLHGVVLSEAQGQLILSKFCMNVLSPRQSHTPSTL